jgi:hypothetical protein
MWRGKRAAFAVDRRGNYSARPPFSGSPPNAQAQEVRLTLSWSLALGAVFGASTTSVSGLGLAQRPPGRPIAAHESRVRPSAIGRAVVGHAADP